MKRKLLTLLLALAAITCAAIAMLSLSACSEKFKYREHEDGYACYYSGPDVTHIDFPSSYKGKPVRYISIYLSGACPSLESFTIPDTVTYIGSFYGCTNLASVTIPDSVTTIGGSTFKGCTGLTDITIPDSVTEIGSAAFEGCTGLTDITIPDSVTKIGYSAFSDCTNLESVVVSSNAETSSHIWSGCENLKEITVPLNKYNLSTVIGKESGNSWASHIPESLKTVNIVGNSIMSEPLYDSFYASYYNFMETVTINITNTVTTIEESAFKDFVGNIELADDSNLESIGASAFKNCKSTTGITLPNSVVTIGESAFDGFDGNIEFADNSNLESIGYAAFRGCTSSTGISLPSSVATIGGYAFDKFIGNIEFANSKNLESVGYAAFRGCTSSTGIHLTGSLVSIGDYAFDGFDGNIEISGCGGLTTIGAYAFQNCANLQNVNFDQVKNLESIGAYAFSGCTALTDLTLTSTGCTEIGAQAFYGCTNLKVIYLPEKLESIGSGAFRNCTSLMSASIPRTVTEIGAGAYYGCNALRLISYPLAELEYTSIFPADAVAAVTLTGGSTIPANSFKYSKISSITFPSTLTEIGSQAFYSCVGLITVDLPSGLTSIGTNAFYGCYKLITVSNASQLEIAEGETDNGYVAAYAKTVTTSAYTNRLINWDGFIFYVGTDSKYYLMGTDVYELTNTVLPDAAYNGGHQVASTYVIYDYAFYNEDASKFTVISSAVSETGENAFNGTPNYI